MKKIAMSAFIIGSALSLSSYAADADINVGLGFRSHDTGYTDYDTQSGVVPLVNIEADNYYVRVNQAGYYLFNDKSNQLSIIAEMNGDKWDSSETDRFKRLDDRDESISAGFQFRGKDKFGVLNLIVAFDVSGNSNGYYGDVSYGYPWHASEKLTVKPGLGIQSLSKDYADYYYGVSKSEATKVAGLKEEEIDASMRPYLYVNVEYKLTDKWTIIATTNVKQLTGDIESSPLVSGNTDISSVAGATYKF
jgi:outer membrane protein